MHYNGGTPGADCRAPDRLRLNNRGTSRANSSEPGMAAGARAGRVRRVAAARRKPCCADDHRDADSHAGAADSDSDTKRHAGAADGDRNGDRERHGEHHAGRDTERHVNTFALAVANRNDTDRYGRAD